MAEEITAVCDALGRGRPTLAALVWSGLNLAVRGHGSYGVALFGGAYLITNYLLLTTWYHLYVQSNLPPSLAAARSAVLVNPWHHADPF